MCYSIKSVSGPSMEGNYVLMAYDSKNNEDVQLVASLNEGTDEYSLYLMTSDNGTHVGPLLITQETIKKESLCAGMVFHVICIKNNDNL